MNVETIEQYIALLFNKSRIKIPFYIFSADNMWENVNNVNKFPICIIQNTDRKKGPGQHWIAWWVISHTETEYFDSYGSSVCNYRYVIKPTKNILKENCTVLQSSRSYLCGAYCIYYLYLRALGKSYENIMDNFTHQVLSNDYKINNFMNYVPELTFNFRCRGDSQKNTCRDIYSNL